MARLDVCILLTRAAVNTGDTRVERSSSEISDSLAANPSPAIWLSDFIVKFYRSFIFLLLFLHGLFDFYI